MTRYNFKEIFLIISFGLILGLLTLSQMKMAENGLGYGIMITQLIIYIVFPIFYENIYFEFTGNKTGYLKTLAEIIIICLIDSAFFKLAVNLTNGTFDWKYIPIRALICTIISYLVWIVNFKIKNTSTKH